MGRGIRGVLEEVPMTGKEAIMAKGHFTGMRDKRVNLILASCRQKIKLFFPIFVSKNDNWDCETI